MQNRQYSTWKILHHHDALADLAGNVRRAPIYIRLKPTNRCIQHCKYCSYGSGQPELRAANRTQVRQADQIPGEKLREIIGDMVAMGVKAMTFSGGGEPLFHPDIAEAAALVRDGGMDLSLITNGQLLSGDLAQCFTAAKWVRFSIDSAKAAPYAAMRGVSESAFDQVCTNLYEFSKMRHRDCVLGVNFVVGVDNYEMIYEAAGLFKELGADNVKFSPMQLNSGASQNSIRDEVLGQLIKAEKEFADEGFSIVNKYLEECEHMDFDPPNLERCYFCELTTIIGADCKVYLCQTRAYDSQAELCDISGQSLKNAWFSSTTTERIRRLLPKRDCRSLCIYESKNKMLDQYFNVDADHINFV